MEQSPVSEACIPAASQEILRTFLNPKVHYGVHKSSLIVRILSQTNSDKAPESYFLRLNFNIILLSTLRFYLY
jgi:hypothetical protein